MLKIKTGKFDGDYNKDLLYLDFEADEFQKHAFESIDNNENVLITAHTGSGKTVVAMYAIANAISKGKTVIYTSPIKSLSNEKYKDFSDKFGKQFTEKTGLVVNLGLMTGDNKINPDGNLIIMTAEILRNSLYNLEKKQDAYIKQDLVDNLGCVIMDEVHFINDPDRGKVWEETIVLLKKEVQLVMLSATIDKSEEFAKWIGNAKETNIALIPTTHRVVPLNHYILIGDEKFLVHDTNDTYHKDNFKLAFNSYNEYCKHKKHKINSTMIPETVEYLKKHDLLQAIFFSFSRQNCEKYAEQIQDTLNDIHEQHEVDYTFKKYLFKDEQIYNKLEQYYQVKRLAMKGICFHHSGLLPVFKEIIEILFSKGLVKVLFATETFAVGVNMPTRTVVFTELEKYTNGGKRFLNTAEYKQMSGRAGRRGIDKFGFTFLLPYFGFPDENDIKKVLMGKMPHIESKLSIDYSFILKGLQNKNDDNFILNFLEKTLLNVELSKSKIIVMSQLETMKVEVDNLPLLQTNKDINKLLDLENMKNKYESMGITTLNKNQLKEVERLKKLIDINPDLKELFEAIKKQNEIKNNYSNKQKELENINNQYLNEIYPIMDFLVKYDYIELVDNTYKIKTKGVIASLINDCNPILLTEFVMNNIFDNLNPQEIVALLASFIDEGKGDKDVDITNNKVYNNFQEMKKIQNKIMIDESNFGIHNTSEYWNLDNEFIIGAYMWASGEPVANCLSYLEEIQEKKNDKIIVKKYDLGNFLKNILKINNLVNDLNSICKITNKLELLPVLEQIPELIIRDVVTTTSLYLQK